VQGSAPIGFGIMFSAHAAAGAPSVAPLAPTAPAAPAAPAAPLAAAAAPPEPAAGFKGCVGAFIPAVAPGLVAARPACAEPPMGMVLGAIMVPPVGAAVPADWGAAAWPAPSCGLVVGPFAPLQPKSAQHARTRRTEVRMCEACTLSLFEPIPKRHARMREMMRRACPEQHRRDITRLNARKVGLPMLT